MFADNTQVSAASPIIAQPSGEAPHAITPEQLCLKAAPDGADADDGAAALASRKTRQAKEETPITPVVLSVMQVKSATQAVKMLSAVGAKFAIVLPDGTTYEQGLSVNEPKVKKFTKSGIRYKDTYKPVIAKLAIGGVAQIPVPEGGSIRALQAAVSGYCSKLWGQGSFGSTMLVEKNVLEIMRYS